MQETSFIFVISMVHSVGIDVHMSLYSQLKISILAPSSSCKTNYSRMKIHISVYGRTFINANSITVKFDNCRENYWTQVGTNVNL